MSDRAMAWALDLPHGVVDALAYRVLLKLADVAATDGSRAWRSKLELAEELQVHPRSVQRAFRSLEDAGLIEPGDQRHVDHIRADKRPTVYTLQTPEAQAIAQGFAISSSGETQRGDMPVDNPRAGRQLVSPEGTSTKTSRNHLADRNARAKAQPLTADTACREASAGGLLRPHRWSRHGFCANGCGATYTPTPTLERTHA